MDDWMELMWLKPSSPRLAVDCLGIFETPPPANPHGKEPPPQAPTSSTFLHLSSFPESSRQTRVTAFLGMIPGHRGLAGISPARPPVWCSTVTINYTTQHGSNRIYSFPRVHWVSPSQPCQRPNQRRFETCREMIGHKQRQPRSGMRLASSFCRPWVTCPSSYVCPLPACPLSLACAPATAAPPRRYHRLGRRMPLGNMTVAGCFASATPRCLRPRRCACHASPSKICTR